jgi:PilZ domain-containing protein
MDERRNAPRIKVNLPTRWEGVLSQQQGQITSLSNSGAFILSGGTVEPKELVRLEIDLPGQEPTYLWAEVVDAAYDIGFAVRFTSVEDEDHKRITDFVADELKKSKT